MLATIQDWIQQLTLVHVVDWGLALLVIGAVLYWSRGTRAAMMIRGLVTLLGLYLLTGSLPMIRLLLSYLLLGAVVATGTLFQPEIRNLLEYLGRGGWLPGIPLPPDGGDIGDPEPELEELVGAVRALSRSRTGALLVIELEQPIDPRIFTDAGVPLNAALSSELVQTIFQPSTPLHDGAVIMHQWKLKMAGVILPMSERVASRQLGTRHRAAIGISEQTRCLCVVVSEETGSISLAEGGNLIRPLTSDKLRELLVEKLRSPRSAPGESPLRGWVAVPRWGRRILGLLPDPIQKKLLSKE